MLRVYTFKCPRNIPLKIEKVVLPDYTMEINTLLRIEKTIRVVEKTTIKVKKRPRSSKKEPSGSKEGPAKLCYKTC